MPNDLNAPAELGEKTLTRRIVDALGWISLLITLALCAPGVVATASAEAVPENAGPSCSAPERSAETAAIELAATIERLREEAAAQADPNAEVVVLNNRGFSYRNPPQVQPEDPTR